MIKEKIYLATPYTSKDKITMVIRYEAAVEVAANLIKKGYIVFSPIVHCHPIAVIYNLPRDYTFWSTYNASFILRWAQMLYVECLEGWEESESIKFDTAIAHAAGISVRYSVSNPLK